MGHIQFAGELFISTSRSKVRAWNVENAVKLCSDADRLWAHGPSFVTLSATALRDDNTEDAAGDPSAFLSLTCWLLGHLCLSYRCSISPPVNLISRSILPRHVPTLTSLLNFSSDETALKARLAFPHCLEISIGCPSMGKSPKLVTSQKLLAESFNKVQVNS
jgi:hypothetical protein